MKHILLFFIFINFFLSCTYAAEHHDVPTQEDLAQEGQRLIDIIFGNAREAVENREDLMTEEWLGKQKEIIDLRNIISDSCIISFDAQAENRIPNMFSSYVMQKINEEIPHIFDIYGISIKQVEGFYGFSYAMCKLSGGIHCGRRMRAIQSDHFDRMLRLKAQKAAREQLRKEKAQQLQDALIFGMYK